ncbi:IS1 family transposase, partial [Escherichia coli]
MTSFTSSIRFSLHAYCSATDGVVRNGKSTAGHQRYLCSHCRKTWQLQFTYTASQPGT